MKSLFVVILCLLLTKCDLLASEFGSDRKPGDAWSKNSLTMKFCWCPAGSFLMGTSDKALRNHSEHFAKQVRVSFTSGFWLGKFEVTKGQWENLMPANPWDRYSGPSDKDTPATYVSWRAATKFCEVLSAKERSPGRLPKGWRYSFPRRFTRWRRSNRFRE